MRIRDGARREHPGLAPRIGCDSSPRRWDRPTRLRLFSQWGNRVRNPHGHSRPLAVGPSRASAGSLPGWLLCGLVALMLLPTPVAAEEPPLSPEETRALEFFEGQVRPLLVNR